MKTPNPAPTPASPALTQTVEPIERLRIDRSATNPRKTFRNLEDLAASIKAQGIIQPLLVRPHKSRQNGYELVFGERRWRAAALLGLDQVPCIVRHDLTDAQVIELQIIENVQRDDVDALEQAAGYLDLMKNHKYTIDMLMEKTGKQRTYIYSALKLLSLPADIQKHVTDGRIVPSIALLLARIPDPKAQAECTRWVLQGDTRWDPQLGQNFKEPRSEREVSAHITKNYMVRLKDVCFDTADAKLLPAAGPCTTCPHRTGNMIADFPELKKSPDVCTKPSCKADKDSAQWARVKKEKTTEGIKVLSEEECKKLYPHDHYPGPSGGAYVDLNDTTYEFDGTEKKWSTLVKGQDLTRHLARDKSGNLHELILKTPALEAAKKNGHKTQSSSSGRSGPSESAIRKKIARYRKARDLAFTQIVDAVEKKCTAADYYDLFRILLTELIDFGSAEVIGHRRELKKDTYGGYVSAVKKLANESTGPQLRGLLLEVALGRNAYQGNMYSSHTWSNAFKLLCKRYTVDVDKILTKLEGIEKLKDITVKITQGTNKQNTDGVFTNPDRVRIITGGTRIKTEILLACDSKDKWWTSYEIDIEGTAVGCGSCSALPSTSKTRKANSSFDTRDAALKHTAQQIVKYLAAHAKKDGSTPAAVLQRIRKAHTALKQYLSTLN